ncbi:TPA: hypothetical protein ACIJQV_005260, partial [Klebsiella pneumoniae]
MAGFDPALGSNAPAVLLDNAKRLDELVNSDALTVPDRAGVDLDTWRGMMAKNDEIRQNLIPLSRQYITLADAQADIANIPEGSTTYYRSPDDSALAIEVMNVGGTLQPTGRKMPSQEYFRQLISSVLFELYNTNDNVFEALSDFKRLLLDNESETVLLIDSEGRKLIVADHAGKVIKAYGTEMLSSGSLNTTLQPKFSDQCRYNDDSTEETVLCIDADGRKLLSLVHSSRSMMIYGKEVTAMSEDEIKEIVVSMLQPLFADQYQYDDTGVNETTIYVDSAGRKLLVLDHAN